jgi:hypothetical protein
LGSVIHVLLVLLVGAALGHVLRGVGRREAVIPAATRGNRGRFRFRPEDLDRFSEKRHDARG